MNRQQEALRHRLLHQVTAPLLFDCRSFANDFEDDGLEMKREKSSLDAPSVKASSVKSMPELVPEPSTETSMTLQPNPPIKDKVDSVLDMRTEKSANTTISPSLQAYAERSSPASTKLPTIFSPSDDFDLRTAPKSPTIDVLIESPTDDWFSENSRPNHAFRAAGLSVEPVFKQWKAEEDIEASPLPESPTLDQNPVMGSYASSLAPEFQSDGPVDDSSLLESSASSIDLPAPPRARSRSACRDRAGNSRSSSLGPSDPEYIARQANAYNTVLGHLYPGGRPVASTPDSTRHLHQSQRLSHQPQPREGRRQSRSVSRESTPQPQRLSQQAQPYDGGHQSTSVSPEPTQSQWTPRPMQQADASFARVDMVMNRGRQTLNLHSPTIDMQAPTSQPQEQEQGSHSSQRWVSSSPYQGASDGIVHVSRYPSSQSASICEPSPALGESQHEENYFPPQQETQPMQPPPIPLASKPRFVSTYIQPGHDLRPTMQRHHTTDVYGHTTPTPDSSFTNYNKQIPNSRQSFDSYPRVADAGRSTAIDGRIAIAHLDSSYRQSKTDLFLKEHADSSSPKDARSHLSLADYSSLSGSQYHAYSTSEAHSTPKLNLGRAYSMSSASPNLSGIGQADTGSPLSPLFPPSPVKTNPDRKLAQVLGSEYRAGGPQSPPAPLNERPLLLSEFLGGEESPMVTRLEYPPSPPFVPDSEASSVSGASWKGKKVLDMPRGTIKKKQSFMGGFLRKKSSMAALS